MEPLWSPVVATGGNLSQTATPQKPRKHAKTFAAVCDRLPIGAHGKEGVDGSSPSEGSAKAPHLGFFFRIDLHVVLFFLTCRSCYGFPDQRSNAARMASAVVLVPRDEENRVPGLIRRARGDFRHPALQPRVTRLDRAVVHVGGALQVEHAQAERVFEREPAELPGGRLRPEHVPARERAGEASMCGPLRCHKQPLGPGTRERTASGGAGHPAAASSPA
jgi:hypothetical protein